ncbi:MAG: hypothetical protein ACJ71P_19885 [Nitrososphaeraceae archaeon]
MEQEKNEQVQWRRDKVQELCSKGYSQREISQVLQVGLATVNRDISYLRSQANIRPSCFLAYRNLLRGLFETHLTVSNHKNSIGR